MSDHLRQSSTGRTLSVSSSPGRPSPLSRPHWPWSTYTHRSSSSSTSINSTTSSTPTSLVWDSRPTVSTPTTGLLSVPTNGKRNSGISSNTYHSGVHEEPTTRQWSFNAFEWVVRDVHRLKDYIEGPDTVDTSGESNEALSIELEYFELLKESPVIGDGKFKLEIAKTTVPESTENSETTAPQSVRVQPQTLSLYITCMMLDYPQQPDYEMPASMFTAIKCQDDKVGERGARAEWAWEYWQDGWVFRQESEVWECPLPSLSFLLENPRIQETDSFVICVQMHSPVGPFFPQQPSAYYVPRDLLEGLEASLDNPNTGDVQFICLERKDIREELLTPASSTATDMSRDASSSQSSTPQTVARKRIIFAHADILVRRSEYFATMLSSSFSESSKVLYPGERKVYTVVVEEADFVTIYWMLKFVYANWLLFRKADDPREAVDGIGAGWSARGLSTPGTPDEWDWKTFSKGMSSDVHNPVGLSDARSVTSAESARSNGGGSGASRDNEKSFAGQSQTVPPMRAAGSAGSRAASSPKAASLSSRQPPPRRSGPSSTPGGPSALAVPVSHTASPVSPRGAKQIPVPISPPSANYVPPSHYPISPRQQRNRSHPSAVSSADPHVHPTPQPQPASALSMYQIAHRYAMPGLASLALEHILSTITPQTSFSVLLATAAWEELHSLVEDYVVEKWEEVSVSDEFERCCQEVASGEWGPEGGKTLMALLRRLRPPSTLG